MTRQEREGGKTAAGGGRHERLASQLRANLKKRRAKTRAAAGDDPRPSGDADKTNRER